jgi:hypothetical protein
LDLLSDYISASIHVMQADEGCGFDFPVGSRGAGVPRHSD